MNFMFKIGLLLYATLSILFCFSSYAVAEKYKTVEELNQQAMEDVRKLREDMKNWQEKLNNPNIPLPKIDLEKYDVYVDFKNVFLGVNAGKQWTGLTYENKSSWAQEKKEWHKQIIEKKTYDFIVMPVEDSSASNDLISRKLAADFIGAQIAQVTGKTVMPTQLVLGTLGDRAIVYDDDRLYSYKQRDHTRIVHLLLKNVDKKAKDQKGFPDKELAFVITQAGKVEKYKIYPLEKVSAKKTLEIQILDNMTDMVQLVTTTKKNSAVETDVNDDKNWSLNSTIIEKISTIKDPLDIAAWLQLIACLTPNIHPDARNHLFERSITSLNGVNKASKYYKLFMARAMQYLHRRPLALAYVEGSNDVELMALQAYINGNYYELKEALGKITNPLLYTISYLELLKLSRAYDKPVHKFDEQMISDEWGQMVQYAIDDKDYWAGINTPELLKAMIQLFPEFGELLAEEFQSQEIFGNNLGEGVVNNILGNLISKIRAKVALSNQPIFENNICEDDFWLLYRDILINIPLKPLYKMVYMQGAYTRAVKYGETLEPVFRGFSAFEAPYAIGLYKHAIKNKSATRNFYLEKAYNITCKIKQTSYKHEINYRRVSYLTNKISRLFKQGGMICGSQGGSKSYYPSDQRTEQFTTTDFDLLESAYLSKKLSDEAFDQQYSSRFNGSPGKIVFGAMKFKQEKRNDKAIELLEEAIQHDKQSWEIYALLAQSLIEDEKYPEASNVYFSFPDFLNKPSGKRVQTSNLAYMAGDVFDQIGKFKIAAEFYEFSSSFNTGAGREMLARYRLAIMDKDYYRAAKHAYSAWSRYDSVSSLEKYLSMLSLLGESDHVHQFFKRALEQYDHSKSTGGLWKPMFIDHRIGQVGMESIEKEIKDLMPVSASDNLKKQQQKYFFLQAYIDRTLSVGNVTQIHQYTTSKPFKGTIKKKELGEIFSSLSECSEGFCEDKIKKISGVSFKDQYAHSYLGLSYIQNKEYEKAAELFLYYDSRFNILKAVSHKTFALPYATMGFIHHPKATPKMFEQLKKILVSQNETSKTLQGSLSLALICAYQGDKKAAIKYLEASAERRKSSYTVRSPFPLYQLLNTAEWLYEYTADQDYLLSGLKWAKRHQALCPQTACAYTFEALYSQDPQARIQAAGFAQYLDSSSRWLSRVPQKIRLQGVEWWEKQDILSEKKQLKKDLQVL